MCVLATDCASERCKKTAQERQTRESERVRLCIETDRNTEREGGSDENKKVLIAKKPSQCGLM